MNGWHAAANRSETCTLFSRDIDVSTTNAQLIMAVCFAALLVGLLGLLGYSVYKNQKAAKQATLHATAPAVMCPLGIMPSNMSCAFGPQLWNIRSSSRGLCDL